MVMLMVEVMLLPLLLLGAGLAFIVFALNDKADGPPNDQSRRLPTRQEHPLYHLHMRIRSSSKPSSASRASTPGVAKLPPRR
jgi:hypothetical protein